MTHMFPYLTHQDTYWLYVKTSPEEEIDSQQVLLSYEISLYLCSQPLTFMNTWESLWLPYVW